MLDHYDNTFNSERSVELAFYKETLLELQDCISILDIGGIPSNANQFTDIYDIVKSKNINYKVADFRGGDYVGNFVALDIQEKFDLCVFLSSLEHFPQCTESDKIYRHKEDVRGYKKALSVLNDDGHILLTVPFGFSIWQDYHQNYDYEGILELTNGSSIIEQYIYVLLDNKWIIEKDLQKTKDIRYTDKCYCVGCFLLRKN